MSEGNEREIEKDEKLSFKNGKRAWCMKSFWSRQLSVCIKIILMMFLPFYFVNSKHTQTQESRVCSRYPTTHFQVFKRGCKLIKRREEQVLLCDILRDKTNGHFSDDDDGSACKVIATSKFKAEFCILHPSRIGFFYDASSVFSSKIQFHAQFRWPASNCYY